MAGLHFDITGDNSNLMDKLRQTENGIRQTAKTIEQSGVGMERMFNNVAKAAAGIGAAFSAQQFAGQVMKVRGEFQQLEVAFNTMLGSAEKANTLMTQLTRTAAITPFGLQDVAGGAKQLLAYGVASEQVNDTLVRLGDIAAGLSIPLNDLVYLYGTTMTQGQMFTQDLRQFQGRGIPLADELAKQFGVTKDKVGELVTAGKVGFEDMHKAIVSMTSDGGKFGGLMEAQSKTITGQISNIQDAIDGMFNEIGKSSEGMINAALDGVSTLVENLEKVADAIGLAAASYGSYKAALMVTTAVDGVKTDIASTEEIAGLSELLGLKEEIKNADLEEAVAKGTLSQAKADYMAKLREEVQERMAILNLQKEEAEAEAQAALDAFNAAKQEKQAADERLENMMNLMEAAEAQGDASYTAYAQDQLQTASANANTAANRLNTAEKNLNAASSKAKAASTAADTFATNANTVANNANTRSLGLMKAAALQLQGILKSMYATLMANPLAIVVGAVGALTYGIYQYATRASAAEKATKQLNDALEEQSKKQEEQKRAIDELISSLGNVEISEGKRIENFYKLKQEYPEILRNINTENEFLKEKHKILQLINKEQSKEQQKEDEKLLYEAETKLKRWEQHRKQYGDTSLVDVDGNGWASDNVIEAINAQRDIVDQLKAKISQPVVEGYLAGIKELKDEDIVSTLEDITNTLKALDGAGDSAIGILSNFGEVSKSQLKIIKSALLGEQDARGGEKLSASQWLAKYKKEYEASVKAISDFQKKKNELSEVEFERQLKELKDKRDAAKKKYEDAGGTTKIDNKKKEQEEKAHEQLLSIRRKNQQNEINLMKENADKKKAQIELNYQIELDAIEKQREEWKKAQEGILTDAQHAELGKAIVNAEDKRNMELASVYESEAEAMRNYLKQYGSFQQQKLAIAEEYAEKIKKAQTEGEKKTLEKERDKSIQNVEIEAIKQQIDWGSIFGDFGTMFKDQLEPTIEKLQQITQSKTFKESSAEDQKLVYGIINSLQKSSTVWDGDIFKQVSDDLDAYKKALEEYNKVMLSGTATAEQVSEAQSNLARTTTDLQNSSAQAQNMFTNLADGIKGLASGNLEGIGKGLMQLDELFKTGVTEDVGNALSKGFTSLFGKDSKVTSTLTEALGQGGGMIGQIISAVLSILDIFKDGIGTVIADIIDTVLGSITNIIDNILTGKFLEQIGTSLIKGIGGILDSITQAIGNILTFGLADGGISDWVTNSNEEEVAKTIERLTDRNEILTKSIDALRETMEKSRGSKSIEAYEQAVINQKEKESNLRDIAKAQAGYHSAHHSWSYYFGNFTPKEVEWIQKNVKPDFTGMDDFWKLSTEEMKKVQQNAAIWERIVSTGEGGYGQRVAEKLQDFIDEAGTIQELTNQINEALTGISFDGMYDSFISDLMDMEKSAEDIADNVSEYFMKAMLSNTIGEAMYEDLQNWYTKFSDAMKSGGLSEEEIKNLRAEYENLVAKGIAERDAIAEVTGYGELGKYSQEASKKGFGEMSQDTAEELNGRFTALQISNEEIKNQMIQAVILINQMVVVSSQGNVVLNDILTQLSLSNNYLADIVKYSKIASLFGEKLDAIVENTKNL